MIDIHGELVPIGGGDAIPLEREALVIGRRESCDICFKFPNVSSVHCKLTFKSGYWFVQDLNSTNGIKVNGTRVHQKMLYPGDEITLAKRRFVIQYELPVDRVNALEDAEEEVLGRSLLERAGLEKPKNNQPGRKSKSVDIADYLLKDDEDE
jgi:adenylate cyclase